MESICIFILFIPCKLNLESSALTIIGKHALMYLLLMITQGLTAAECESYICDKNKQEGLVMKLIMFCYTYNLCQNKFVFFYYKMYNSFYKNDN